MARLLTFSKVKRVSICLSETATTHLLTLPAESAISCEHVDSPVHILISLYSSLEIRLCGLKIFSRYISSIFLSERSLTVSIVVAS